MNVFTTLTLAALAASVSAQTPSGFSPSTNETFGIRYGNTTITGGTTIAQQETFLSPAIDFSAVAGDSAHVLVMFDIDAPNPVNNTLSPLLHWMLPVPEGVHEVAGNDTSLTPVATYGRPQPPAGLGPHRYTFLLLEDPSPEFHMPPGFENVTFSDPVNRLRFDLDGFIEAGSFQVVAGNYFRTENSTSASEPTPEPSPEPAPEQSLAAGIAYGRRAALVGGAALFGLSLLG